MIEETPGIRSQITFLYYKDLAPIERFYGQVLRLELMEDQGWAKIYAAGGNAFIGIVAGKRAFHQPRRENSVLITLVVDDVDGWYAALKERGANLLTGVREMESIQVRGFFLTDPGGYTLEIQQFLDPDVARIFHQYGR
ncbi:MAG: VOC family protein [Anaerolineae bacterium]|jgi:predicted enzyme related to lactoylglutathione lyase